VAGLTSGGGYITYDETTNKFSLSEEQAFALADEESSAYLPGAFELALGSLAAVPRDYGILPYGNGMGWHEHVDASSMGVKSSFVQVMPPTW